MIDLEDLISTNANGLTGQVNQELERIFRNPNSTPPQHLKIHSIIYI